MSLTVHDQLSQRQRDRRFLTINIYFVWVVTNLVSKNINIQRYKINTKEVRVLVVISYKYSRVLKNSPLEIVLNFMSLMWGCLTKD